MRQSSIYWQNKSMEKQQRNFRAAADIVTAALMTFPEIAAIGLTGSTAKPLWKEVPRFREFKRAGIKVWHECGDVDLAVWLDARDHLGEMRLAKDRALRLAYEAGTSSGVANHQIDIFLFEPESDRYLGHMRMPGELAQDYYLIEMVWHDRTDQDPALKAVRDAIHSFCQPL